MTRQFFLAVVAASVLVLGAGIAPAARLAAFGDGTYRVGRDIPAGTYRTRGGDGCYWARLRSFSGSTSAILANDNAEGPAVVTLLRRDKGFETERCGRWSSNLARITRSMTRFGVGEYIVNRDIAPGTYRASGGDGCYRERLRSFTGTTGAIIANDLPSGRAIVTIAPSDRGFKSARCGTWRRF
jgi:hypothetical protein